MVPFNPSDFMNIEAGVTQYRGRYWSMTLNPSYVDAIAFIDQAKFIRIGSFAGDAHEYEALDWKGEEPIPKEDLDLARLSIAKIAARFTIEAYSKGFMRGPIELNGFQFDIGLDMKTNLIGACVLAVVNGNQLPANFHWPDVNGIPHPVMVSDLYSMIQIGANFLSSIYENTAIHLQNIAGLTNIEQVASYDYSSGWPNVPWFDATY